MDKRLCRSSSSCGCRQCRPRRKHCPSGLCRSSICCKFRAFGCRKCPLRHWHKRCVHKSDCGRRSSGGLCSKASMTSLRCPTCIFRPWFSGPSSCTSRRISPWGRRRIPPNIPTARPSPCTRSRLITGRAVTGRPFKVRRSSLT